MLNGIKMKNGSKEIKNKKGDNKMSVQKLKENIESVMNSIQEKHHTLEENIAKVKKQESKDWVELYGMMVKVSASQKEIISAMAQDGVNELMADFEKTLKKKIQEGNNYIADEKKRINQEIVAAEPVPTREQAIMEEQIVKQYHNLLNPQKFFEDMQFHVANETVKAIPYYLAAKELFPDDSQVNVVLRILVPEVEKKEEDLLETEEIERIFKSFCINFKLTNTVVDGMQSIRLKQELADLQERMKEYERQKAVAYNQPRIDQIVHSLNQPGLSTLEIISLKQELAGLGGMAQLDQSIAYVDKK